MLHVFGDCVLDTTLHVLHRAGQPVQLRPKVFQVLVYLLAQRQRVVPKQELSEQVWPGQFISDATLESTVRAVRRALGDTRQAHRMIQTLYGYGYRFVAPVEEQTKALPHAADEARCPNAEATPAAAGHGLQTGAGVAPLVAWMSGHLVYHWRGQMRRCERLRRQPRWMSGSLLTLGNASW